MTNPSATSIGVSKKLLLAKLAALCAVFLLHTAATHAAQLRMIRFEWIYPCGNATDLSTCGPCIGPGFPCQIDYSEAAQQTSRRYASVNNQQVIVSVDAAVLSSNAQSWVEANWAQGLHDGSFSLRTRGRTVSGSRGRAQAGARITYKLLPDLTDEPERTWSVRIGALLRTSTNTGDATSRLTLKHGPDERTAFVYAPGVPEQTVDWQILIGHNETFTLEARGDALPSSDNVSFAQAYVTNGTIKLGLIDKVEITQTVQVLSTLDDLVDLGPKVPVIANRATGVRVFFRPVSTNRDVEVKGTIVGPSGTVPLECPNAGRRTLNPTSPSCATDQSRLGKQGPSCSLACVLPPLLAGNHLATLEVFDRTDIADGPIPLLERHAFPVSVTGQPNELTVVPFGICDDRFQPCGKTDASSLGPLRKQVESLFPFGNKSIRFKEQSLGTITLNRLEFDSNHDGTLSCTSTSCELDRWWGKALELVESKQKELRARGQLAPSDVVIGITRSDFGPSRIGGLARISGGAAVSTPVPGVFAHELAHMIGRGHADSSSPCGRTAPCPWDWPFTTNELLSCRGPLNSSGKCVGKYETGYDMSVTPARIVSPESHFELMSYCNPQWVSPYTYCRLLKSLTSAECRLLEVSGNTVPICPGSEKGATRTPASRTKLEAGLFWIVAGSVTSSGTELRPLFQLVGDGSIDAGNGTYRIEVRDAQGAEQFVRRFTPVPDPGEIPEEAPDRLTFWELVPVQPDAAQIVILDELGVETAAHVLTGAAPTVSVVFPLAGAVLTDLATVRWDVEDADSAEHHYELSYSTDDGATWWPLGQFVNETEAGVYFDVLPGCDQTCRIRVVVSDGVNIAEAISETFSVPSKQPTVTILEPASGIYLAHDTSILLRALAIDPEDGSLPGESVVWQSSLDGLIGAGDRLWATQLSPGTHAITASAIDSDGMEAFAGASITVAGPGPVLSVTSVLDPNGCEQVTLLAEPGSVALSSVAYSLDDGITFIEVGLPDLPLTFPVRSSTLVVAHAWDVAGQETLARVQFAGPACQPLTELCGDGITQYWESCDGTDLNGNSCALLGFAAGSLACQSSCQFDVTSCEEAVCGDGIAAGQEVCDSDQLLGATCEQLFFAGGVLTCASNCDYDTTACLRNVCGNGVVEETEVCDDGNEVSGDGCHADCTVEADTPGEASGPSMAGMRAGYNPVSGGIDVTYAVPCAATNHRIVWGPLASVADHGWTGVACDLGASGTTSFDPGSGDAFFVIVADDGDFEGSYGTRSDGTERPEALAGSCDLPQALDDRCEGP